jgi:hypothetical protein
MKVLESFIQLFIVLIYCIYNGVSENLVGSLRIRLNACLNTLRTAIRVWDALSELITIYP